ncbi:MULTISPECIES: Fe-S-containing hydro-lyase [Dehalococcoides]|jgi:fumarate hydratase subunit beta|nr:MULTISPECIES: Fe-S-containing hydro-lyase [Dehalococcoides]AGG06093.1 fumarate hydratase class I, small subunit [Dehalococcoides mccartyi DCMB5]AQU05542.1 fumarate hydratase [Dehalococcoides mccartyi]AQU06988.1 fumarate hydratase [Dehalococcoides mccartyi]AQX72896.1 fumarate hydratase [Dehalococcoides mccartyi]AQX74273.1 fumarate hydratase [Dehalococcoides mccartyi]
MSSIKLNSPFDPSELEKLQAGDRVLISGVIYTARDAAHKRLVETLKQGKQLPFDLKGQTIYYMGPSPAKPGEVIGSAGPTTSSRMDPYTPELLDAGLRAIIGKGNRSAEVSWAIVNKKVVYFISIGGAGALLSQCIKESRMVAYPELGAEAILALTVENFPAIVAIDSQGNNAFTLGQSLYRVVGTKEA